MSIKLTCPQCGTAVPLTEPLPMPGDQVQCTDCAAFLAVSYPTGVMDKLREKGKRFTEAPLPKARAVPRAQLTSAREMGHVPSAPRPPRPHRVSTESAGASIGGGPVGTFAATVIDRTTVDPTQIGEPDNEFHEIDRTVPAMRSPYGQLAGNIPEPEGKSALPAEDFLPTSRFDDEDSLVSEAETRKQDVMNAKPETTSSKGRIAGCMASLMGAGGVGLAALLGIGVLGGAAVVGGTYWYYSQDLPSHEALKAYEPPTVTVVSSTDGRILGEIFDQRRYVVPVDQIPQHVKDAFLAAEDANFYNHGGVDFVGIGRAVARNARKGRMAQGASTITQQVARNFLLTRDKKIERKIKEVILSWRIESTYTKDHILYLYLNEIFLGSQAYGVDAASKAYFGKGVREISVAEAAILAGLPQRPSDYSPHRHWDKARARQEYVIGQMVAKEYITAEEGKAALDEMVLITPRNNAFLEQAPHFTEHVRRYLVEKYGEEMVLNQGLQVTTTCDLDLQRLAQDSVSKGVFGVDQRMGFRREGVKNVGAEGVAAKRAEHEAAMRKAWAFKQDAAGRIPEPEKSILVPGEVYDAVITDVSKKWAKVAIGDHDALIPMAWSKWVYDPNPRKSWRYRTATDLTEKVDTDDDRTVDTPILKKGDVITVKVEALSSKDESVAKAFKKTPGESESFVAIRLWQDPEVESALLSLDLATGAVRSMVGGADFTKSQFNRAVQSRRQVGSTFKPIVYAAAIETKKVTTASMVADAPLAFATSAEFVWKPANYGHDYLGNITLRKALAMSRNTCTVRVLESVDPGMNDDVVYEFARRLGIGGPPLNELPADLVVSPENDVLCPWTRETSESTICMSHYPPRTDTDRSNTGHRQDLTASDKHMCRSCDMSMGLGSASLTMEELVRAYSAFATAGDLVKPYYIEEVRDRHGNVLEKHETADFPQVMDPSVASITRWLLEGVVQGGTGFQASKQLGLKGLGGKTGTTNDEKDTWFIGFSPDVITAVWVGYDQPRSLGISSTGGRTALPIWIDYMREAAPMEKDRAFKMRGDIEWAQIDEVAGNRVSSGGRAYPFIGGTAPESTGLKAGQVSMDDLDI